MLLDHLVQHGEQAWALRDSVLLILRVSHAARFSNPLENAACTLYPARRNSGLVASIATSWVQSTANDAASNSASVARLKLSVRPKPLPDPACVTSHP